MDILVGWHIDHTQKQSVTQQVSGHLHFNWILLIHLSLDVVAATTALVVFFFNHLRCNTQIKSDEAVSAFCIVSFTLGL